MTTPAARGVLDLDPGDTFNACRGGSHCQRSDHCAVVAFAEVIRQGGAPGEAPKLRGHGQRVAQSASRSGTLAVLPVVS